MKFHPAVNKTRKPGKHRNLEILKSDEKLDVDKNVGKWRKCWKLIKNQKFDDYLILDNRL